MPDDRSRADRPPTLNKELLLSDLNAQFENISDKGSEDAAQIFARNAATIAFDDLPPAAVRAAKLGVLDTLGVILAATGVAPGLDRFAELAKLDGGRPESTILGFGGRVPAPSAAFVNGASAHAIDFDDIHDSMGTHPSAPVVSATMALAERLGGVSGRELLAAVAVGQDFFVRLTGSTAPWEHGLMGPCALGGLATAVSCSRLLGLDEAETYNAISIASCQAGAPGQLANNEGSNLRSFYASFSARSGLVAALLAQRGVGGIVDVLESKTGGVFRALFDGEYDRDRLVGGVGTEFPCSDVSYKAYPACRLSNVYIDAILEVVNDDGVEPRDITSVKVRVGQIPMRLCQPDEARRHPRTVMDAKFSIPFIVGLAMARRGLSLRDFSAEALRDPAVLAETDKVSYVYDESLDLADPVIIPPGIIEVTTSSGTKITKRIEVPYGHPKRPISDQALHAKFTDNAAHAAVPIPATTLERVMELLDTLETSSDVAEIPRLLGGE